MVTKFQVKGMRCAGSSARVERIVKSLEGVPSCRASLGEGSIEEEFDKKLIEADAIKASVSALGYRAG